ncbi:hypothetical protein ACFLYP_02595 [Chloroflexota bacterium]
MRLKTDNQTATAITIAAAALLLAAILYAFFQFYPLGVDWEYTFSRLSEEWRNPFVIRTFTNPPWVTLLLPHAWLPLRWGNAVNLTLNIILISAVIWKLKGGWQTMLLVFTSPVFFDLARTNNIGWVPMLAVLLPPTWGLPILAIKPHTIGGAALIWWKKAGFNFKILIPATLVIAASFAIWGWWPGKFGLIEDAQIWNFAPWPLGIPLGLYMLYRAWQQEDEFLAAAATPFLTPYLAPYSIAGILAYVGSKYRRQAFFVYVAFWVFFVVESRRMAMMGN